MFIFPKLRWGKNVKQYPALMTTNRKLLHPPPDLQYCLCVRTPCSNIQQIIKFVICACACKCASVHVYDNGLVCLGVLMHTLHNVCSPNVRVCVSLNAHEQRRPCGCSGGNWWMGCLKSRIWMKKRGPWGNTPHHCNQSLDSVPAFD